jgi:septal ring factor EnvC (AmiA/AmiB activator)
MGDLISVQKKSIHQITKLTETVDSINNKVITNEKILNNINDQIAKMDKNVLSNNLEIADNLKISSEILSYVTDTLNMIGNNKMAVDTHYVDLNTSLEKLLMLKTGLINLQKVTILTRAELSQHLDQVILYYQKK